MRAAFTPPQNKVIGPGNFSQVSRSVAAVPGMNRSPLPTSRPARLFRCQAQITAKLVKELRDRTNAGMMDCKKALETAEGNLENAITELRKKGAAKAVKKAGRDATEGQVLAQSFPNQQEPGSTWGLLLEVNCETDFVSRGDVFQEFATEMLGHASKECLEKGGKVTPADLTGEFKDVIQDKIATLGENIRIGNMACFKVRPASESRDIVAQYIHMGGRIGALVELSAPKSSGHDAATELAHELAMQVACAPDVIVVSSEKLDKDWVDKERSLEESKEDVQNKPENVRTKMVEGRIKNRLKEVSLLDQPFFRGGDKSVAEVVKEASDKIGGPIEVMRFARFGIGQEPSGDFHEGEKPAEPAAEKSEAKPTVDIQEDTFVAE